MKTKVSIKNKTVSWTGKKPRLKKALESFGFDCCDTGGSMVAKCNLDPRGRDNLEWCEALQCEGMDVLLHLCGNRWKVEINRVRGAEGDKDIRRAMRSAYGYWWKAGGRVAKYEGAEFTIDELVTETERLDG